MAIGDAAALDAIHAAYSDLVRYTGAGLVGESIAAVKTDSAAQAFQGPGSNLRQVSFEIRRGNLPQRPSKKDRIVEGDGVGAAWKVNDITERADIDAWVLIVEAQ